MLIAAKQNRTYWQRFEMGVKQISRSFDLARNTVRRYVRFFQECGIPIKDLAAMPSARIQEMFSEGVGRNRVPSHRQLELEALLPEYAARLSRRGVTVKTLYEEYRQIHPNGYKHPVLATSSCVTAW